MDQTRILAIGDDPNILRVLRRNLFGRGYDVSLALDDQEAYEISRRDLPDLTILILDFASSSIDGLRVLANVRELVESPIIVLSASVSEDMKVQAFDLGADDYLVMPFSMNEFLARVRSVLRRWTKYKTGTSQPQKMILAGELSIDTEGRQVQVRGEAVKLTPTEYDMLLYFVQRVGKVISHRELLHAVWGAEYGEEREYLRVYISQLRRKIEKDPLRPVHILTEPGVGYRFTDECSAARA
jgi:two-component system, OmpR family, KDP operon response regulator KdpE